MEGLIYGLLLEGFIFLLIYFNRQVMKQAKPCEALRGFADSMEDRERGTKRMYAVRVTGRRKKQKEDREGTKNGRHKLLQNK